MQADDEIQKHDSDAMSRIEDVLQNKPVQSEA